jgi:hypothetical protein
VKELDQHRARRGQRQAKLTKGLAAPKRKTGPPATAADSRTRSGQTWRLTWRATAARRSPSPSRA